MSAIMFAGFPIKLTDAVFTDHIKVEGAGIFCGHRAFAAFHTWARNPRAPDDALMNAFQEAVRTKRSVRIEAPK